MRVVHIERKSREAERDARVLEQVLQGHARRELTAADASALSGLPLDAAEAALVALAGRFPARLGVSEGGVLLVRFDSLSAPRRGSGAWAQVWSTFRRRLLEPLVAVLTVVIGPLLLAALTRDVVALASVAAQGGWVWLVAIPCMAVGAFAALGAIMTFLAFFVLPLAGLALLMAGAALIYMLTSESGGTVGTVIFVLVFSGICLVLGLKLTIWGVGLWWTTIFKDPTWAKVYWTFAVGLLLGPGRPEVDALADEQRLTALIRHRKGIVALSDLIGLFGWTPAEADRQIARILCDYGGDVVVTDDGAILYAFTDPAAQSGPGVMAGSMLTSAGVEVAAPKPAARVEERLFSVSTGAVIAMGIALGIGALGVLVHPAQPLFPGVDELLVEMPELATDKGTVRFFGLGLWPYAVFFGVPLLRVPAFLWRRMRARRRRELERYLAVAAKTPEGARFAGARTRVVAELGGDYDGTTLSFPELARSRAAAERLRAAGPGVLAPGKIAFE